jgi:Flp pilus assembly protein TadD
VPAHLGLAEIMAMQGKLPEAETLMRRAATLAPDSADVWNGLGEALRMAGNLNEAVNCYNQATERSPRFPSPYNNLGIIHAVRGQPADAEKMFRSAVDLAAANPRHNPVNYLMNLGLACQDQSKFDEAEKAYREAMRRDPLNGGAFNALAWMLAERGQRLNEALEFGLKAVELQPDDPHHLDTLGWVHVKRGEFAEAERRLKRALQLAGTGAAASGIRERLQHLEDLKKDQK